MDNEKAKRVWNWVDNYQVGRGNGAVFASTPQIGESELFMRDSKGTEPRMKNRPMSQRVSEWPRALDAGVIFLLIVAITYLISGGA